MELELAACPEEVKKRGMILYSNGFSGFQEPEENGANKDRFILCWPGCRWSEVEAFERDVLPRIRERSGAKTLELGDWIGRDYISIHWSEHSRRFQVLSALLVEGVTFQTQTKGMPRFDPKEVGTEFTQDVLEWAVIKQTDELIGCKLFEMIDDGRCEEWNWTTTFGKYYCRVLRALRESQHRGYDKSRTNFYEWKIFAKGSFNPETLCNVV